MDLDDLLFIVRAGGTVRAAAAKGDAFAGGGPWGVAWRRGVEDETAFHGGGGAPEEKEQAWLAGKWKGIQRRGGNNCSVIIGAPCFILMRPRPYWADGRLPLTRLTASSESGEQPPSLSVSPPPPLIHATNAEQAPKANCTVRK